MGVSAKNQQVSNFKNTMNGFKNCIGRKFSDPRVQIEKKVARFNIVRNTNDDTLLEVFMFT